MSAARRTVKFWPLVAETRSALAAQARAAFNLLVAKLRVACIDRALSIVRPFMGDDPTLTIGGALRFLPRWKRLKVRLLLVAYERLGRKKAVP